MHPKDCYQLATSSLAAEKRLSPQGGALHAFIASSLAFFTTPFQHSMFYSGTLLSSSPRRRSVPSILLLLVAFLLSLSITDIGVDATPTKPKDLILLADLPRELLPHTSEDGKDGQDRRLIIVGDVHGESKYLRKLLNKIDYNNATDHLVLAGDMIHKGPDSVGVLEIAMSLGASCVRGNHEDHLLTDGEVDSTNEQDFSAAESQKVLAQHDALRSHLSGAQLDWLRRCPVILRVGKLGHLEEVVVVHAGLNPGVRLEKQDSWDAMNMRSIKRGKPNNGRKGKAWAKVSSPLHQNPMHHQRIGNHTPQSTTQTQPQYQANTPPGLEQAPEKAPPQAAPDGRLWPRRRPRLSRAPLQLRTRLSLHDGRQAHRAGHRGRQLALDRACELLRRLNWGFDM